MSNKERLQIVLKPYLTAKDIALLCECSQTKAYNLMTVVRSKYPNKICIFGKQIKTADFLSTYELSLDDFIKSAELEEKYLKGAEN